MSTANLDRAVSPFKFSPSLSPKHEEELRKRAISREFALASGVRTAGDNELRELNFQASLPYEERSKGLQGICFPYVDLELKAEASLKSSPTPPSPCRTVLTRNICLGLVTRLGLTSPTPQQLSSFPIPR